MQPLPYPTEPLVEKARDFTNIEDVTLDVWLRAENAGLDDLAAAVLDAGLMKEHYRSLLDADSSKWTPSQHSNYVVLTSNFGEATAAVNDAIAEQEAQRAATSPLEGKGDGSGEASGGYTPRDAGAIGEAGERGEHGQVA